MNDQKEWILRKEGDKEERIEVMNERANRMNVFEWGKQADTEPNQQANK